MTLLDNRGVMVAERRLRPADYLGPEAQPGGLAEPREVIDVDLLLEDPGETATGFKLNFL